MQSLFFLGFKKWRIVGPRGGIADLSWLSLRQEGTDDKEKVFVSRLSRPEPTPEVRCAEYAYTQKLEKKAKKKKVVQEIMVKPNKYGIESLLPIYPAGYIMDKTKTQSYFETLKNF